MSQETGGQPAQPQFDPNAPHQARPRLRPVRLFPAQVGGQTMLGIADARQISAKMVLTLPAAQMLLPLMDGVKQLDEIVKTVGRGLTRPMLEQIVAQLDDAGLLHGPTFDAMLKVMRDQFDAAPTLPPSSTADLADAMAQAAAGSEEAWNELTDGEKRELGAMKLREQLDAWIAEALKDAEQPSLDQLPKAIVAPHLDFQRGWLNYASSWGRLRVADRPDRVVILGTNHFGEATGVCGCDKGFESPLGVCEADRALIDKVRARLGPENAGRLFEHRFDHEREHSIELQVPWLQHCLGKDDAGNFPRVFAALVHDPVQNNGESYDGKGLALDAFLQALRAAIAELPGKTLVVASADMSHVGPQFGDQVPLVGDDPQVVEARNNVFRHDRDMINLLIERKPDELVAAMSWQGNHTRWCSVGNLIATMRLVEPAKVELFNFAGAMDQQGQALVTSASMAMT
jgi:AmmeMemoRadiSam system protein B